MFFFRTVTNRLPWLSLRIVHAIVGFRCLFYCQVVWSRALNFFISLVIQTTLLLGTWHLLLISGCATPLICAVVGGLCLLLPTSTLREIVCAIVGLLVLATSHQNQDIFSVSIGVGNLVVWLLLKWELAEASRVWYQQAPLITENINVGSAKLLKDTVHIFHLFLETPEQRWGRRCRRKTMHMIQRACRWMVRHAKSYNAKLHFEHHVVYSQPVCFEGQIPMNENNYAGLPEFEEFLSQQLSKQNNIVAKDSELLNQERCLLVHFAANIGEGAYAVPNYHRYSKQTIPLEYAVVGAWRNAAVYAHEILHLFGADDFNRSVYFDSTTNRDWDAHSANALKRSIMFYGDFQLEHLVVDELTAQCIGWQ